MLIENDYEYSNLFKTTLGVRQGGIMSPKLFSIYLDDLIAKVEDQEHGIKLKNGGKIDIIQVKYMKYLGVILTDDNKNTEHISKCKLSALKAYNKLKKLSLLSNKVHPNMKGHIKRERLTLKRTEGNLVKFMFGVPTRCRTTDLLCALKIEATIKRLDAFKCDFYLRLRKNVYTNELLDEVKQLENSLSNEIMENKTTYDTNESELDKLCSIIKYHVKSEFKAMKSNNPKVAELIKIFDTKEKCEIQQKIFQIIKFT
ncbi:unnamed protein product [Brachionus calyciflorus]|uniref:Reverse transcriptase domain-containing protein n=1 Tax=Brachionus calyciflorus TaxID=104777 RepID=A0A813VFB5_9BILA|nr:unnamed protein product [Brachionus calyciflorus]